MKWLGLYCGPALSKDKNRQIILTIKCELGRYFGSIDWSILDSVQDCESKLQLFQDLVKIGLDTIMPLKTVKLQVNDPPWV